MQRHSYPLSVLVLTCLVACPTIAQVRPSAHRKGLKFKIYVPLKFKGRTVSGSIRQSEIGGLLDLPVRNGSGDPHDLYGVDMTMPDQKMVMAYTCRQWERDRADGAYAYTTYSMAMEGFMITTCGLLLQLQRAKPPLKSFIANPRVSLADLNLLPADMLETFREVNREPLRGKTVAEVVPAKDIVKATDDNLKLSYGGLEQSFWEAARADFNGDGIEDMLVFKGVHAERGSMGYTLYFVLTRLHPSGPMKVIPIKYPWQKH